MKDSRADIAGNGTCIATEVCMTGNGTCVAAREGMTGNGLHLRVLHYYSTAGVLPYLCFGLATLCSLFWDILLHLDASRPHLYLMPGCLYSGLTVLYYFVWDTLFLLAASQLHLSLLLSLLCDQ